MDLSAGTPNFWPLVPLNGEHYDQPVIFFSPKIFSLNHLCHVEMPAGCTSSELTMAGCVTCAVCRGSNVFVTDTWPPIVRLGDFGSALKAPPTEVRKVGGKGAEQMTLSIKVSIAGGV